MQKLNVTPKVLTIDPVTRIEGHLKVSVTVDKVGGRQQVVEAQCTGTMFRGLEKVLEGRDPWDAVPITQRICGVCPVPHGTAAAKALEAAAGVMPADAGRLLRNLIQGADHLHSHVLHFYHLALLDFADGPSVPPWDPQWTTDKRINKKAGAALFSNYVTALDVRRLAHSMGAIFAGKLPHAASLVPGGVTVIPGLVPPPPGDMMGSGGMMGPGGTAPTVDQVQAFKTYLAQVTSFVTNTYLPDVQTVAAAYPDYFSVGAGCGNLLAFGAFDLDAAGRKLLPPGRAVGGAPPVPDLDTSAVAESVTHSWYDDATDRLPPAEGKTNPVDPGGKASAYSWIKAPRYGGAPYEVGPLARMRIAGYYPGRASVMDRHVARANEAQLICRAMLDWINAVAPGRPVYNSNHVVPGSAGAGLTEAPRGALGHWLMIGADGKLCHYQVITPTCWNASPRDTQGVPGPIEQALVGTPVRNVDEPIEVLRVIHSFDPCLACAVHVTRPGRQARLVRLGR